MSISAGNVISVALALAWVWGIYAYWRRDEKRNRSAAYGRRLVHEGPAGEARETEETEGPAVRQEEKGQADPAEPTNQK